MANLTKTLDEGRKEWELEKSGYTVRPSQPSLPLVLTLLQTEMTGLRDRLTALQSSLTSLEAEHAAAVASHAEASKAWEEDKELLEGSIVDLSKGGEQEVEELRRLEGVLEVRFFFLLARLQFC